MNTGIFGENFPYSNFHDLNLDWIIKIVKDFLDQYTSLNEVISNGEIALDEKTQNGLSELADKAEELEGLLQSWYDTHSDDIEEALTTAVNDFQTSASAIAETVIASIPADYSALANTVSMMGNAFPDLFSLITERNYNTNYANSIMINETASGITVKNSSNIITVNGTATGNVQFSLFNSRTKKYQFPFKAGRTYPFSFIEQVNTPTIQIIVRYKTTQNSSWHNQSSFTALSDISVIALPDTFYEFDVCLSIASGATYSNKTIEMVILNRTEKLRQFDNLVETALLDSVVDFNLISPTKDTIANSFSGVKITNNGHTITLAGRCTTNRAYELITDYNAEFIKPNTWLKIEFQNNGSNATFEIVCGTSGSDVTVLQTANSGVRYVQIPNTATSVTINLVLFSGTTYNTSVYYKVSSVPVKNNIFHVDKIGNGDFTTIKNAVEFATKFENSTVYIDKGNYNLVTEFGETYLDSLSDNAPDYGMFLENNIHLIFSPLADVSFDYDGANTWVISNFSPFNTGNKTGYILEGLNINARNCKYILHDDPRPGYKTAYSRNIIKNCFMTMFPSPDYADWRNHQIIGGGFSDQNEVIIENCRFRAVFTDDITGYPAISYHNSTSGSSSFKSLIVIKDCMLAEKNQIVLQGYGSSTNKSQAIITNNYMYDPSTNIVYDNTVDNIDVYRWNNVAHS